VQTWWGAALACARRSLAIHVIPNSAGMNHRNSPAFANAKKREARVDERIVFHTDKIEELADLLTDHYAKGGDENDAQHKKSRETLQIHRRKLADLKKMKSELKIAKRRIQSCGVWNMAESFRQGAIWKYGIDRNLTSQEYRDYERAEQAARRASNPLMSAPARSATLSTPLVSMYEHRPSVSECKDLVRDWTAPNRAQTEQKMREHARLTRGPKPGDPFMVDDPESRAYTADQIILLKRIFDNPKLVEHYPHTQNYLDETPESSDATFRVAAKAAVDEHRKAEEILSNHLPLEMQEIHERIAERSDLSDLAKLILLITTFIPAGSYTSYTAIREWIHDAQGNTATMHVTAGLRRGSKMFAADEVPTHRVIERSGGIGGSTCEWGTHFPYADEEARQAWLEEEGCRFDKNGRILGSRLEICEVEEQMKGTIVAKYVTRFSYRFGGFY
jgi:alkylated DNA nucleotide flippase Atl1